MKTYEIKIGNDVTLLVVNELRAVALVEVDEANALIHIAWKGVQALGGRGFKTTAKEARKIYADLKILLDKQP